MRILGISAFYHDSAAALVEDGRIIAAVQEERFTRIKHDAAFPLHAVRHCLERAAGQPDLVVYYEKPLLKFERILSSAFATAPRGFKGLASALPLWLRHKLWIPLEIEKALETAGCKSPPPIRFAGHHESHAASAFYPSPFESAAILTLDGVGEWSTATQGLGRNGELRLLRELRYPHSPGLLYSAFTQHCGFRVNSGEYKLMGLAPYGEARHVDTILKELMDLREDGSFRLNLRHFAFHEGERMTAPSFAGLFGIPERRSGEEPTQDHCDLARSVQAVIEEIVLRMARSLHAETGEHRLCLAGGVALNCVANGRLLREGPFSQIWIQPAAGDAGGALGAALALHHSLPDSSPRAPAGRDGMQGAFLGPDYAEAAIDHSLAARGLQAECLPDASSAARRVAKALAAGKVVGVHQGRAEFGPRALGARSILADPRVPDMQSRLNLKIKFRESFRPFAPIVLAEEATRYFDLGTQSPYMLLTAPVARQRRLPTPGATGLQERLHELRSDIPSVTHVDHSARVQTVELGTNPWLHEVLEAFRHETGCAVLINTSFNVRGEPPVCSPDEAIEGFLATGMDCLCLGTRFLDKACLPAASLPSQGARQFAPD